MPSILDVFKKLFSQNNNSEKETLVERFNRNRSGENYWYRPDRSNCLYCVPVTVEERDKLNSLGKQERQQFFRELLKEREPEQYNDLVFVENRLAADEKKRHLVLTPWKRNGSPTNSIRNQENDIKAKWNELLDYARANATGKGRYREIYWLRDSFNEYLEMADRTPGYALGRQPGSQHSRDALAEKILQALGPSVSGSTELNEQQINRLKESLIEITTPSRGLHR